MRNSSIKVIFRPFIIRLSFLAGIVVSVVFPSFCINTPVRITNDLIAALNDSTPGKHRINFTYDNIKNYIFENLEYPPGAKNKEITGDVQIRFTIDTTGNIKDICIVQSAHPLLDQEAIRLIKNMPHWKPITYRNKKRLYIYTIPIIFELKESQQK